MELLKNLVKIFAHHRILLHVLVCFFLYSCNKEKLSQANTQPPPPPVISNPLTVVLPSVIEVVLPADSFILSASILPAGVNIKSYYWQKISGPDAYKIEHPDSLVTKIKGLQPGSYTFQLSVTDNNGSTAKAVVVVNVVSLLGNFEFNSDLDINARYEFFNNAEICPWDCYYADLTVISTSALLSNSNILQVYINEETDSSAKAFNVNYGFTAFRLSNQLYASGNSAFDLKKLIQEGGGTFSGTIKLTSSSALRTLREDAFKALPPLIVTGKLDTLTKTVNIQIKGKIIF